MASPLKQAWYKWKSLRLPWRKQWLVGADLSGNTFWEFKDALNANRLRRIVRYTRKIHYADVKISRTRPHCHSHNLVQKHSWADGIWIAQWHQWLRHTRDEAPSIQEQQYDVSRQAMMKRLAAEADERWKSIPSYLDAPSKQQPQPAIGVEDPGGYAQPTEPVEKQGVRSTVESEAVDEGTAKERTREKKKPKENPWAHLQPKGTPGESWQPQEWSPGVAQRGR